MSYGRADRLFKSIDTRFEDLNILVSTPSLPRPKRAPHCDCRLATEAFFNEKLSTVGRGNDRDESYTMVPTTVRAGTSDVCDHCGYTTSLLPIGTYAHAIANRKSSRNARVTKSKPIIGVDLETGEQLEFPSAAHAYKAGHGNVQQALQKRGGLLHGVQWRRVK